MKNNFPWINAENSLFDVTAGSPLYLPTVGISEVKWLADDPYKNTIKAIVTLCEELRDEAYLLSFENRTTLEVIHRKFGPRDWYELNHVVAQFSNCEILSKWIDDLIMGHPDLIQVVGVFIQMRVDFIMFKKEIQE